MTLAILHSYYPVVRGLRDYLYDLLEPVDDSWNFLTQGECSLRYREFLEKSYVTRPSARTDTKRSAAVTPMVPIKEVGSSYVFSSSIST